MSTRGPEGEDQSGHDGGGMRLLWGFFFGFLGVVLAFFLLLRFVLDPHDFLPDLRHAFCIALIVYPFMLLAAWLKDEVDVRAGMFFYGGLLIALLWYLLKRM